MRRVILIAIVGCLCFPTALLGQQPDSEEVGADARYGDLYYLAIADPFNDEDRSAVLSLTEDEEAAFGWKCRENGLNVIYVLGGYMGGDSDSEVLVRYRIDSREPSGKHHWRLFQEHATAYMPMDRVESFTRATFAGDSIVTEVVDPADGERRRHKFGLDGARRALQELPCASHLFGQ